MASTEANGNAALAPVQIDGTELSVQVPGYPKLATILAGSQEYMIFRRFSNLNMRNALYLQAELMHLELELETHTSDDFAAKMMYHANWKKLKDAGIDDKGMLIANTQYGTIMRIRSLIGEYNNALLQNSQLNAFNPPYKEHRKQLLELVQRPSYCASVVEPEASIEATTWDDLVTGDFVSLNPNTLDPFTRGVVHTIIDKFHALIGRRMKKPDIETGLYDYSDSAIAKAGDLITLLLSTVVPVGSIIALYYTPVVIGRFFVALGFCLLLAILLWSLSTAKRGEVFALSTAFLAIEVVFIGSANLSSS